MAGNLPKRFSRGFGPVRPGEAGSGRGYCRSVPTCRRFGSLVASPDQKREVLMSSERNKTVPVILAVLAVAALALVVFAVFVVATA